MRWMYYRSGLNAGATPDVAFRFRTILDLRLRNGHPVALRSEPGGADPLGRDIEMGRLAIGICLAASLATASFAADAQNACKGDPNQWQQVFDGKDLTGWKHVGPGHMTVDDGLIHTHGGMGLLYWTAGPIAN